MRNVINSIKNDADFNSFPLDNPIDLLDNYGRTPVHYVCKYLFYNDADCNSSKLLSYVLQNGYYTEGDIDIGSVSALYILIESAFERLPRNPVNNKMIIEMINTLISYGADPNCVHNNYATPYSKSVEYYGRGAKFFDGIVDLLKNNGGSFEYIKNL